jgi:hypothetical protein
LRTWGKDECRKERISGKEETTHGTLRTREKMSFKRKDLRKRREQAQTVAERAER